MGGIIFTANRAVIFNVCNFVISEIFNTLLILYLPYRYRFKVTGTQFFAATKASQDVFVKEQNLSSFKLYVLALGKPL